VDVCGCGVLVEREGRSTHRLEETDDGRWTNFFNGFLLATFDERDYMITG
jgi:hypothetical protein